jgi:hypothetical protein
MTRRTIGRPGCAAALALIALAACGGGPSSLSGDAATDSADDSVFVNEYDASSDGSDGSAVTVVSDAAMDSRGADQSSPGVEGGPVPEAGPEAGPESAVPITVAGQVVVDNLFSSSPVQPIASRNVTIVDANGRRTNVTSDATGAFSVGDVVPPYDALVAQGPSAQSFPKAFLGVSTPHPRLLAFPDSATTLTQSTATVNLVVQEPACGSSPCFMSLIPYDCSPTGVSVSGGVNTSYGTAGTQSFQLPAIWESAANAPCIGINVLVSNATYTQFWYGQVEAGGNVANGATVTSSPVSPQPIPSAGAVTVTETGSPQVPAAWTEGMWLDLNYPYASGGGIASLPEVWQGTSVVSGVPNIIGATLSAAASAGSNYNSPMPDPYLTQSVEAVASNLPLSTSAIALTLPPPISFSSPLENGALSLSTGSFVWTWGTEEVMLAFLEADGDAGISNDVEIEVFTDGSSIELTRLAALGVSLTPSRQDGSFDGIGKVASLDAMLDENTLAVPDRSQSAYTEIVFTLTP